MAVKCMNCSPRRVPTIHTKLRKHRLLRVLLPAALQPENDNGAELPAKRSEPPRTTEMTDCCPFSM